MPGLNDRFIINKKIKTRFWRFRWRGVTLAVRPVFVQVQGKHA